MNIPNIENHMVLPHAEPPEDAAEQELDEDEIYEIMRQQEIDDARKCHD